MIDDDIRTALLPCFPTVAPADVILAHQNGGRPHGLYVTLRIESVSKLPEHVGRLVAPDPDPGPPALGYRSLNAHRTGTIELQAFGALSFEVLDIAMQRLATDEAMSAAHALNMTFRQTAEVQNVPLLRNDATWEPRAVASLGFAYTRAVDESLAWIETVEGLLHVEGAVSGVIPDMPISASIVDN